MYKVLQLLSANFGSIIMGLALVCSQFLFSCSSPEKGVLVFAGTYTNNGSEGIYSFRFDTVTGEFTPIQLAAKTENPSFIAIDTKGEFLYAVNEVDNLNDTQAGAISVFSIDSESGKLNFLQSVSSLGKAPCHLSIDKSGKYILVANYNSGNFAVFPIKNDGTLGEKAALVQNEGTSVNTERQNGPHAHCIQVTGNNKFVMVADLGIDRIVINKFDVSTGGLTPGNPAFIALTPGDGPRHFSFSPTGNFLYVLNELTSTVSVFGFDPETAITAFKQTISTLPPNFAKANTAAEIVIDKKGKYLYVSNRGDNSIVVFSIDGEDGSLTFVDRVSSGGKTPRNFAIDPTGKWMLVANQDSDSIIFYRIDQETGRLIQTSKSIRISSPVCLRFVESI